MKRTLLMWGVVLAVCFSCTGCASIFAGGDKTISIASKPEGANFTIKNPKGETVTSGKTPTNVTLKRGRGFFQAGDYAISFSKEGYKDVNLEMKQGIEPWYWGNIIFGGLVGCLIVDPLTGAMWNLEDVDVQLESKQSAFLYSDDTVRVLSIDDVPTSLQSKMVRIN